MMTMSNPAPRLMKERQRHSRWFALLVIPFILFNQGALLPETALHEVSEWAGYLLIAVCVLGRSYCSLFIGGRKNDVLVDSGPFSVVRNPLYVFSFMGIVGVGLQNGSVTLLLLLVLAFLFYYYHVIEHEEQFLEHMFGEAYRQYKQRVPRWIPKISLWKEPETVSVRPHFIFWTMRDAAVFFLPLPVFELIETLQVSGYLPIFTHLP